jgi:hypothetical protein
MKATKRIVVWGALLGAVVLFFACKENGLLADLQQKVQQAKISGTVATPVFTPPAGSLPTGSQTITITGSTPGATIYYTTDGTTPSEISTQYTAPFSVNGTNGTSLTIKAIAVAGGMNPSTIAVAAYNFSSSTLVLHLQVAPDSSSGSIGLNENGIVTHPTDAYVNSGVPVALEATPNALWLFDKWTVYSGTATIANSNAAITTVTLTTEAVIKANFARYHLTVTYDGNGSKSGSVPSDANSYWPGNTVAVLSNTGSLAQTGYTFAGWNTKADGTGTSYAAGATFTEGSADVTLYAVWIPSNLTFTSSGSSIMITGFVVAPTGSLTIPGGVTGIGASAFSGCSGLTGSLTIPSSVTSIGQYAFSFCWGLTGSLTIPSSVTSISGGAFYYCQGLTSLTIPSSVTSIGDSAFLYCLSLTSVTISQGVTSIGASAFGFCSGLIGSLTIPSSVTSIGAGAFGYCSSLTSVTISPGVTSIGDSAFDVCSSLTYVIIPSSVTNMSGAAFMDCTSLTSITIPSGITSIGPSTFAGCTSLTSITIPSGITSIGKWAFLNCTSLTGITVQATTPPALSSTSQAFDLCAGGLKIHVPSGTLGAYQAATGWSVYKSQIVSP